MGQPFNREIRAQALRLFAQGLGVRAVHDAISRKTGDDIGERTLREWWQRQRATWTADALQQEGIPAEKAGEVLALYHVGHAFAAKSFKLSGLHRDQTVRILQDVAPLLGTDKDKLTAALKSDAFPWETVPGISGEYFMEVARALRTILGKHPEAPVEAAIRVAFVRGYHPPQEGPDMQYLTFVADRWEEYTPWRTEAQHRSFEIAVAAQLLATQGTPALQKAPGMRDGLQEWTAQLISSSVPSGQSPIVNE